MFSNLETSDKQAGRRNAGKCGRGHGLGLEAVCYDSAKKIEDMKLLWKSTEN